MTDVTERIHDVIIIGSGPAGLTAAIYAARANLAPLVVEGLGAGGQLMNTTDVENYPGFPEGILGPELMDRMRKQADRFGAEFATGEVKATVLKERPFRLTLADGEFTADTLIVATGARPFHKTVDPEAKNVVSCLDVMDGKVAERRLWVHEPGTNGFRESTLTIREP